MKLRVPIICSFVILTACGGEDAAPVAIEEFFEQQADAQCDFLVRCVGLTDRDLCAAYAELNVANIEGAVENGTADYDPSRGGACISAHRGTCDQVEIAEACADVFAGTRREGQDCVADQECAKGFCKTDNCDPNQCCEGECTFIPEVDIGEPCDFSCVAGAYCAADGTCHPLGDEGDTCDESDFSCGFGLGCVNDRCIALGGAGDSCESDEYCDFAFHCGSNERCTAWEEGDACEGSFCGAFMTCDDGACRGLRAPGERCADGTDCAGYFGCESGECAPYAGYPEDCF